MLGNKGTKKFYRSGGTRGGQSQFKWEDVKTDKERENYLGHSVNAAVGRWQKGRDIHWYTKGKEQQQALADEKRRMQEMDDDVLNAALGYKVQRRNYSNDLDSAEIKQLISKGGLEREEIDIERVKGLGAGASRSHEHIEKGETQLEKQLRIAKQGGNFQAEDINRLPGSLSFPDPSSSNNTNSTGDRKRHRADDEARQGSSIYDEEGNVSNRKHSSSSSSSSSSHHKKHKKHDKHSKSDKHDKHDKHRKHDKHERKSSSTRDREDR